MNTPALSACFGDTAIVLLLELHCRLHARILSAGASAADMQNASILTLVELLREEIKLIQNQERLYRAKLHHSSEEITAHARRELRLLDIQAELHKLGRSGSCRHGCNVQLSRSSKPGKHF